MNRFGYDIKQIERGESLEWLGADGLTHTGPTLIFEATGHRLWMQFMVQSDEDSWFTTVRMAVCKPESSVLLQVMRKTDVYNASDRMSGMVYHPLGMAYLEDSGRLRRERLSAAQNDTSIRLTRLISAIRECGIQLIAYEDVTTKSNASLKGKLCSVISHNDFDKMVYSFLAEKVIPVTGGL